MQSCIFQNKCSDAGIKCDNKYPLQGKCSLLNQNTDNIHAVCPRCISTKAVITNKCTNEQCNFHTKNISYNCLLIHNKLFYHDSAPKKAIQAALGISERSFNRMTELSIFLMRGYSILIKYLAEQSLIKSEELKLYSQYAQKAIKFQCFDGLCNTCGTPIIGDQKCACSNPNILKARLWFQNKWSSIMNKLRYGEDALAVLNKTPHEMVKVFGEDIHTLRFTRYLMSQINLEGVYFKDIPFGFIYNSYTQLFNDASWKTSENLGLNDQLYDKAINAFSLR